jgi:hypothetical protein
VDTRRGGDGVVVLDGRHMLSFAVTPSSTKKETLGPDPDPAVDRGRIERFLRSYGVDGSVQVESITRHKGAHKLRGKARDKDCFQPR